MLEMNTIIYTNINNTYTTEHTTELGITKY